MVRIGVIYPSDGVRDAEFWDFAPDEVSLHFTREIVPDGERPLGIDWAAGHVESREIDHGAASLKQIRPAAVAYACTSISFVGGKAGDAAIRARIEAESGAPATTTSLAMALACQALGLREVAVATPYDGPLAGRLTAFLEEFGVSPIGTTSLTANAGVIEGESSQDRAIRIARDADLPAAEGLLVACTNLPTHAWIADLEQQLEKPVVTANQATVWHACKLAGVDCEAPGLVGSLWRV